MQTEKFLNVPNVKFLKIARPEGSAGKSVIDHTILVFEKKKWKVLYCDPRVFVPIFAKLFEQAFVQHGS